MSVAEDVIDYGPYIVKLADCIDQGNIEGARAAALEMLPRIIKPKAKIILKVDDIPKHSTKRKSKESDVLQVLRGDQFHDRYTGLKLVIPPALRLISLLMPDVFPYHKNWAKGKCHDCYWDLSATIDHLVPISKGGTNELANLVSTSMSKNLQKGTHSVEQLGWKLIDPPQDVAWDGLCRFFKNQMGKHSMFLQESYFRKWYNAVKNIAS